MTQKTFEFWTTFKESYLNLLENKENWIKVACGPWVIVLIAAIVGILLSSTTDIPTDETADIPWSLLIGSTVTGIISFAASIMFTLRALRYRLLEEVPEDYISFEWNIRHWKYVGVTLVLALLVGVPSGLASTLGGPILGIVAFLVTMYFISRFILYGAVIAADGGNPFIGSWKLSVGWTWLKLLALVILVCIPVLIVLNIVGWILGTLVHFSIASLFNQLVTSFIVSAVLSSALAACYKKLS